jgi:endonuclease I
MTRNVQAVLGFIALLQQSRWGFIYAQDGSTAVSTTCSVDQYYAGLPSDPTTWTRDEVADLIRSTHTTIPPYIGTTLGEGDVWHALIQVDAGDETDTVSLIFNGEDVDSFPVAARNWKKQHLWPIDRGLGESGPDYSDVHGIRPVDQISDVVRANKFFGDCGVLEKEGVCVEPAEGGGTDTCVCNRSYQPPVDRQGEIARALMYMDLRYDGSEADTTDLTLTDCPFNRTTDMGYLSQMLQWNTDSAPSEKETSRNDAVCQFWQGNRNPFVDFPGLADTLFGPKLDMPAAGREIYEACEDVPTSAPTFSDNDCQMINPGDVVFSLVNSEDPDNVELFAFEDLPAGLELYLTDNAWDGLKFLNAEGILKVSHESPPQFVETMKLTFMLVLTCEYAALWPPLQPKLEKA